MERALTSVFAELLSFPSLPYITTCNACEIMLEADSDFYTWMCAKFKNAQVRYEHEHVQKDLFY
jgi:hypothetical protein